MKRITSVLAVSAMLLLVSAAMAQSSNLSLTMWSTANGGGQSTGGRFTLAGTAGQINAGGPLKAASYTVNGGFWPAPFTTIEGQGTIQVHLPLVLKAEAPTPQPAWQRIGNAGLVVSSLAIQGDQLFASDRRTFSSGGGLYKTKLTDCGAAPNLNRIDSIQFPVQGVIFQGIQGAAAVYDDRIFYSGDGGITWSRTTSNLVHMSTVAIANNSTFFAGSQDDGIYLSNDSGAHWELRTSTPKNINRVKVDTLDANSLWIATEGTGVWKLTVNISRLIQSKNGLSGPSLQVWDFVFDNNTIYIATFDGVFKGDGANDWQPIGLQGQEVYSLEIVESKLYAGIRKSTGQGQVAGVRWRNLDAGEWQELTSAGWNNTYTVRDLLYDPTLCNGLLAATDDGIWLYK